MSPRPPTRRGACPALTAPMETGDGLLVRLVPAEGRLSPAQLSALAEAAEAFGNGIVEVTARGSLQLRGLRPETVDPLNAAVARLAIVPRAGLPVDISPLAGLDPSEIADARPLAARIRAEVAPFAARLGPKVSVVIDGGGAIGLDALKADVRLKAEVTPDGVLWAMALAGDGAGATPVARLPEAEACAQTVRRLADTAARGTGARMADVLAAPDPSSTGAPRPDGTARERRQRLAIGLFPLAGGSFARGVALPFGAVAAATLRALAAATLAAGARDLRPAPGRVLIACGLAAHQVDGFVAAAQALGCLVTPDDPRAAIIACPGAPACASAHMPARAIAEAASRALAPLLDGTITVHLSACAKGCAHPAPAALTLVGVEGGVALMQNAAAGQAGAPAFGVADLPRALRAGAEALAAAQAPGETGRSLLARLPFIRPPAALEGSPSPAADAMTGGQATAHAPAVAPPMMSPR